jgi:tight adherence protein B
MSGVAPLLILVSSVLAFGAAFLAAQWIGPAWDAISQRHIADISPRLKALNVDESEVGTWLRWWGVAMFAAFFFLAVILGMPPVAIGAVLLILVAPRYVLDRMIKNRQIKLRDQLVRATIGVANGCRAGLGLPQSIEKVAQETPAPLAGELKRIVRDYRAGRPLQDAIREVQHRLDLEAFNVFASSVVVALEKGGNITFALERISHGLQEMQRLERKLEADSAAGRKLATVLSAFPILFLALFTLMDPVATGFLYTTLIGQLVLVAIGLLVFIAARWCMAILNLDF